MKPKNSPHRSRRLRKKLHLDEFQALGFEADFTVKTGTPANRIDVLFDDFIERAIEANGLSCGGGGGSLAYSFFVEKARGKTGEADRLAVMDWFSKQEEIASFKVGELVDAWYCDLDEPREQA